MLHRKLALRAVVSDLVTPISMAFLGADDILMIEKNTGQVKRIVNGVVQAPCWIWLITESESLLIGRDFGVVTDIKTGPNGNLFVIWLDQGTIYEIFRKQP